MASTVEFRNFTFPSNWSNVIVDGTKRPRVKQIFFPGTPGGLSLNMATAERNIVHTGTIRLATQGSLNTAIDAVNSLCDGVLSSVGGGATSFGLKFHGRTYDSVYSPGVQWGQQSPARGDGGISATAISYFAVPFTINYVKINP